MSTGSTGRYAESGKRGKLRAVAAKRIAIVDKEKCKPNTPGFDYLRKAARACPQDCIRVAGKTIAISEDACSACLSRAKRCPDDCVRVVQLPAALDEVTHSFGMNSFKLHGLPVPKPASVLGLLGSNGTGKSTVLKILSGRLKPNLGSIDDKPGWHDIVQHYRGSELQTYFKRILEGNLVCAMKPQLDAGFARKMSTQIVGEIIAKRDERKCADHIIKMLRLGPLLDRRVADLSGGELQCLAVAITCLRKVDVYMFDEPSAFLDVKQRLQVTYVIRSLLEPETARAGCKRIVIVVDHDLSVLDYMSDQICCLYGESSAFGVVSKRASHGAGINHYLNGYLPSENVRFRDKPLVFKTPTAAVMQLQPGAKEKGKHKKSEAGCITYPGARIELTSSKKKDGSSEAATFVLHVDTGVFKSGEIIGLLGQNGCGKSTFMRHIAGKIDQGSENTPPPPAPETIATATKTKGSKGSKRRPTAQELLARARAGATEDPPATTVGAFSVSFKRQHFGPKLRQARGTVTDLLERRINSNLGNRLFRLNVMKPLRMHELMKCKVRQLSGGQLQRVAIVICLGTPAELFLLDEPSAFLDCEQRAIVTKVIRRWVVSNLGKTAFIVEHDLLMASALYDRVITFEGKPGIECRTRPPRSVDVGFNDFLKHLNITLRRDPENGRPRINKPNSMLDVKQRKAGQFFIFQDDDD